MTQITLPVSGQREKEPQRRKSDLRQEVGFLGSVPRGQVEDTGLTGCDRGPQTSPCRTQEETFVGPGSKAELRGGASSSLYLSPKALPFWSLLSRAFPASRFRCLSRHRVPRELREIFSLNSVWIWLRDSHRLKGFQIQRDDGRHWSVCARPWVASRLTPQSHRRWSLRAVVQEEGWLCGLLSSRISQALTCVLTAGILLKRGFRFKGSRVNPAWSTDHISSSKSWWLWWSPNRCNESLVLSFRSSGLSGVPRLRREDTPLGYHRHLHFH